MDTSKVDYDTLVKGMVGHSLFDDPCMTLDEFVEYYYAAALAFYNRLRISFTPTVGASFAYSTTSFDSAIPSNRIKRLGTRDYLFDNPASNLVSFVISVPADREAEYRLSTKVSRIETVRIPWDVFNPLRSEEVLGNVDWSEIRRNPFGSYRISTTDPIRGQLNDRYCEVALNADVEKLPLLVEELRPEIVRQLAPGLLPLQEFLHASRVAGVGFYSKLAYIVGVSYYFAQMVKAVVEGSPKDGEALHQLLASAFPAEMLPGTILQRNTKKFSPGHFTLLGNIPEGELLYTFGALTASTTRDTYLSFTAQSFLNDGKGHPIERLIMTTGVYKTLQDLFSVVRTPFDLEVTPRGESKTIPALPELIEEPKPQSTEFARINDWVIKEVTFRRNEYLVNWDATVNNIVDRIRNTTGTATDGGITIPR